MSLPNGVDQPVVPQPVAAPPKRKLTWLWITLGVVALLGLGAAGVVVWAVGRELAPVVEQAQKVNESVKAAEKTRLVEPATISGYPRLDVPAFVEIAEGMEAELKKEIPNHTSTVSAVYGDEATLSLVLLVGASAPVTDPDKELAATFDGLVADGGKILSSAKVESGPLGGVARCAFIDDGQGSITVCAWADNGSVGMVAWMAETTVDYNVAEFLKIRAQVEQKS